MKIRIPRFLVRANDAFEDWGNVPIGKIRNFEFRRLDILIVVGFFASVAWYGYTGGLRGALFAALAYTMFTMMGLWFLPRNEK